MARELFDPSHFFDSYPRFVDTSRTGPWLDRLNARFLALIHANREMIAGSRVLDLASHDGRFSFAALQNGASHVTGIEWDVTLVQATREHMTAYGVPPDRYDVVHGDIYDFEVSDPVDVVFCFGILYHINHHVLLLTKIASLEPRFLIIDTKLSQLEGAVIEFRSPLSGAPPPEGTALEGHPSRAGLEAMLSYLGWEYDYFDWPGSGLTDLPHMQDYRAGRRVSLLVRCDDQRLPPDVRDEAVGRVFRHEDDPQWRWLTITNVASELGIRPQTLRLWVERAEQDARRGKTATRD